MMVIILGGPLCFTKSVVVLSSCNGLMDDNSFGRTSHFMKPFLSEDPHPIM